jgi:hypothetical protein
MIDAIVYKDTMKMGMLHAVNVILIVVGLIAQDQWKMTVCLVNRMLNKWTVFASAIL